MNRFHTLLCLVVGVIAFSALHSSSAQVAHLTLQSQPGDPIGQGGTFDITYTPANSEFLFASVDVTIGSPPMPALLRFSMSTVGPGNTFAVLQFGTNQLGIPIQPGFYPNAERAPFASPGHPGLDVSFRNVGCNTLTGNFTIAAATFGANNAIETFAATFEQHCDGIGPALFGSFTYDAHAVPEPATWALILGGAGILAGYSFAARHNWLSLRQPTLRDRFGK